jgi:hypothetical protein
MYSERNSSNPFIRETCILLLFWSDGRKLQVAGVHSIEGPKVTLTNNVVLYPKMLVCATGWTLDLDCLPPTRAKQSFEHIQSRLFCRFYDIDYPGLAFVSLSNGFMCATENANLVSQAVGQILLGNWTEPDMATMVLLSGIDD